MIKKSSIIFPIDKLRSSKFMTMHNTHFKTNGSCKEDNLVGIIRNVYVDVKYLQLWNVVYSTYSISILN